MKWVLLFYVAAIGTETPAVTSAEFDDEASCKAAGAELQKLIKEYHSHYVEWTCQPSKSE